MGVVEMALAGKANKAIVGEIHACGGKAVGFSGRDGRLLVAEPVSPKLGRVGRVVQVNPGLLDLACDNGFVPVVCSVAEGTDGKAINVNADSAAAAIATAVGAKKLFILSDVDGVFADKDDASSLISRLTGDEAKAMIESRKADRGMVPKLASALEAIRGGVGSVHLLNGSKPNSLLVETFTDAGIGTMVVE
jgi:acetylglutamate kinase